MRRPVLAALGSGEYEPVTHPRAAMPAWLTTLLEFIPHPTAPAPSAPAASSWGGNGISESSSGLLFRAVKVRSYTGALQFAGGARALDAFPPVKSTLARKCDHWAVTTTIFPPTTTVKQIAALRDWCFVVAGDKKGPREYNVANVVYLTPAMQEALPYATVKSLRWNHFGRKNAAFLYAIHQGARWVYDTDDDNELLTPMIPVREIARDRATWREISMD